MYILYGGDFTRSVLVQWVLEEGDLDYEFRAIDILKGQHKTAAFLAINPAGLLPVLITPEGQPLFETAALMVYLADRHGLSDLAPPVADPLRGLFLSAIFCLAGDIQSEMKRFHFPHRFSNRPGDMHLVQDMARSLVLARLGIMNERLGRSGPYILGTRFSLADAYLSYWVAWLGGGQAVAELPSIAELYRLVRSRARIGACLEETEQMAVAYAEMMKRSPGGVIP